MVPQPGVPGPCRVVTVIGTRPEVIKMAPVLRQLSQHPAVFESLVLSTAQHREMLVQTLESMQVVPDVDLQLMKLDQGLADFASRSLRALSDALAEMRPAVVLVQGDTTTVLTAALAAFYQGIPVGHVEAGLRSFHRQHPFPEELNRRLVADLAELHFAPTDRARLNLLREGVPSDCIHVTGNTIVDAVRLQPRGSAFQDARLAEICRGERPVVLVSAHRRENHGVRLYSICTAIRRLAHEFPELRIVYPVHLNPNVRTVVHGELAAVAGVHLVEPLSYPDLLRLLERCRFVMTDSGGIQEEAPSFRKPVLILRETTERPELLEVGAGKLVGADTDTIHAEAARLLRDPAAYRAMSDVENPFGDGHAAERIVDTLAQFLTSRTRPVPARGEHARELVHAGSHDGKAR